MYKDLYDLRSRAWNLSQSIMPNTNPILHIPGIESFVAGLSQAKWAYLHLKSFKFHQRLQSLITRCMNKGCSLTANILQAGIQQLVRYEERFDMQDCVGIDK